MTANKPRTAHGDIFVAPFSADQMVGQTGALANDDSGDPVWFRPLPSTNLQNADFRVFAHHGYYPDEHEFTLTRRGTALFEGPDGRLLISARNMWAIYNVTKKSGKIRYQIGGKKNDFTFGPNAGFYWQHDARFRPGNRISMFDDGCCDLPDGAPEQRSHGLILNLDFRSHKATAVKTSYHQPPLESPTQGNTQALSNGNEFIGWGLPEQMDRHALLPTECGGTVRRRAQRRPRLLERLDADRSMAGTRRIRPPFPVGRRQTRPTVRIQSQHD
ncbi:arylsulfotransferase family protein [Streptomyces sp. NPDC056704]|uniref:arylsulfotransferase family protein n=1 Tax=Streptomyces sp. NPDC056704 TaxID=3345917 RepID=UPI0036902620